MSWREFGTVLVLLGAPVVIGVLVGAFYSVRFRCELDEARALARKMYRELEEARDDLQELQETLDQVDGCAPTTQPLALQPSVHTTVGRHRLRE